MMSLRLRLAHGVLAAVKYVRAGVGLYRYCHSFDDKCYRHHRSLSAVRDDATPITIRGRSCIQCIQAVVDGEGGMGILSVGNVGSHWKRGNAR